MGNDGYTIEVRRTESAATALSGNAGLATSALSSLDAINPPGPPPAGRGIGAEVTAFSSGWHDALDKIGKDIGLMASKVTAGAQATVTVEQEVHNQFSRFTQ